ncbi:MAG: GDP-L-fucose synthase [Gammaproteobacteria bacterium]|jgi:GDP-L-fucose synthase|nr:GDP-fucose synthetase [Chromatiales bacterium]MDP6673222.1 GDP-L-fucose synthase [Gammaproteobacteria bacterium]
MNNPETVELSKLRAGKIFVAGHRGMVGSAIVRRLQDAGCKQLILKARNELDLTRQSDVDAFMKAEKPDYVILAAARVGGILANNTYPAQFIYDNTMIAANVIDASHRNDVSRLLFLGSSCIYPQLAKQPMAESSLLTGKLEPTNEPYAIAKISGIKLCESYNRQHSTDFRSIMPTNLYGINDNFDLKTSHVLPALIRKFHEAKINDDANVEIWGSGNPRREFLHVDDLADACLFVLTIPLDSYRKHTEPMMSHFNVGTGMDVTIHELAEIINDIVDFRGTLTFNDDYPDGAPRKLLDINQLANLGWKARINLRQGIVSTYEWFKENCDPGE